VHGDPFPVELSTEEITEQWRSRRDEDLSPPHHASMSARAHVRVVLNLDDRNARSIVSVADHASDAPSDDAWSERGTPFDDPEGVTNMFNLLYVMFQSLTARLRDEKGEVSLEYALVGGLMAAAIIAGLAVLTPQLLTWFTGIGKEITDSL